MTDTPQIARVVVMTGATSGIGAAAVQEIARDPGTLVLVGARGTGRTVPAGVETLPLDLASLGSVREFADAVLRRLGGTPIDALVLNAGTQSRSLDGRTADGFETTFAVNHLAHYLLARLLTPHLADDARIILTTSDTHDPAITPLAPKTLDPQARAHPPTSGFGAGMRAYAASKLCNLLTVRSLAELPEVRERGIRALAYNPGLTGGTNLGDAGPGAKRFMTLVVFPVFRIVGRFKPAYVMGPPERAGQVLAQLAAGTVTPPAGHVYVSLVKGDITYPEPAPLARDDEVRDDLWRQSASMVGLAP
ncbi:SDR family NAD(P)-dependent oxidoreductase [Actinomadura sp. NPDC049382]|uniref:SDR family NAD(P)-dependent oxidoreductase n=1 Tax=Actinomadura sp. NPDC049382 TaxID=3158220 RepID=UPI00343A93E6